MDLGLQDKVAVVTGGSRGIGAAIVTTLVAEGMYVVVNHHSQTVEATELCEKLGNRVRLFDADVADSGAVEAMVKYTESELGRLDLLVHNAGITTRQALVYTPQEDWQRVIKTNLDGAFHTARFAARAMIEQKVNGAIIAISSIHGKVAKADMGAYCPSKAAIDMLVRQLSVELASYGIRVNAVAPGAIDTGMNPIYHATDDDGVRQRERLLNRIPMAKLGTPDAVGNAVAFLASDCSGYSTGVIHYVDGGYSVDGTPR